jgi:ATP-dependent RNA circularization protein (DNA/RNA ligase family)
MDLAQRTDQAISSSLNRLDQAQREQLTSLNEKFDRLEREGIVVKDSYGVSMEGPLLKLKSATPFPR